MRTEFKVNSEVWIMTNQRPKKVTVKRITIDSNTITYELSSFWYHYTRNESEIGKTKQELFKKLFEL
jgi:hypothetical protein